MGRPELLVKQRGVNTIGSHFHSHGNETLKKKRKISNFTLSKMIHDTVRSLSHKSRISSEIVAHLDFTLVESDVTLFQVIFFLIACLLSVKGNHTNRLSLRFVDPDLETRYSVEKEKQSGAAFSCSCVVLLFTTAMEALIDPWSVLITFFCVCFFFFPHPHLDTLKYNLDGRG